MTRYVAGLMFDHMHPEYVGLIRKNRPSFLRNKLNAIGGHIEANETPEQAMVREFVEETAHDTTEDQWLKFAILYGDDFELHLYTTSGPTSALKTETDEQVVVRHLHGLNVSNSAPDLLWFLPMAIQRLNGVTTDVLKIVRT